MALYLVTGGAGFIGSHVVDKLLAEGHAVRVLDNLSTGKQSNLSSTAQLIKGDVCDLAQVTDAMTGTDGVIHLAAIASVELSNKDWLGTHRVNQTGSVNVFETARRLGGLPVVYASSAAVYGTQDIAPISERVQPRPVTAYGADKLGSELHAAVATYVHQVPTLGLRFFNVYGPRQDPSSPYSGVISIFISRMSAGQKVVIHGDGEQTRDFIYVADVVDHISAGLNYLRARPTDTAQALNVCTGRPTSILQLAREAASTIGMQVEIAHGPSRQGDIKTSVGDPAKCLATLGVAANTTLRVGLEATYGSLSN